MPARTGAAYIANLHENPPEIYMQGERIVDVTTHPALRGGVGSLARLLDMQHDPVLRDDMTYTSPSTGDPVGLSFITPRTMDDLQRRHTIEIALYPTTSHQLPKQAPERYVFAFALPCHTPGLKFMCRESFDLGRSHFDHPLGSRFEEMDAVAFFDHVLVPWERVFLLGDVALSNDLQQRTNRHRHTGHQIVTKNVIKCEFILGLATLMTRVLDSAGSPHVRQMLAEIIENLQVTKACLRAAEVDAEIDEWGVMCPAELPLQTARNLFIRMYPRMAEILHLLGSSNLMALPTEADLNGPLAHEIKTHLETDTASAADRVRLFRLAWDTCCSAFGTRQVLYERFFQADAVRNAMILYDMCDAEPMVQWVREFLEQD